jgi:hypothetical protein
VGKADTLANKRAAMLSYFQKMGATNDRVLAALGVRGVEDIGLEHMATLRGLATAIKDGETSVDAAFPVAAAGVIPMPQRASARVAQELEIHDRVTAAEARGTGWIAMTADGLRLWTRDPGLGALLLTAIGARITGLAGPPDGEGRRELTGLFTIEEVGA